MRGACHPGVEIVPHHPTLPPLGEGTRGPGLDLRVSPVNLVQLLWNAGRIVVLDFDDCTRGDPALDLGNLLTQLRRLTLRKPGKLPDFTSLRRGILAAYQACARHEPGLAQRVAWYEQTALVGKIHSLTFDRTRHPEAEAIRRRQAEAMRLLTCEHASITSF